MSPPANKAYPFFDGVTVKLDTMPDGYPTRVLSYQELTSAINATFANVSAVGQYARIQSKISEQYHDAGGNDDTSGANWLKVVRKLYQDAWGTDEYFLMTATALAKKSEWGF
ncbi:hypothetical protein MesoLj113a_45130 [Mesorhizobium sp. 113-1-2]|nr:hypothetical protein MesoLj113a_45130 [Mesorhizobium sp. 113-1-2]